VNPEASGESHTYRFDSLLLVNAVIVYRVAYPAGGAARGGALKDGAAQQDQQRAQQGEQLSCGSVQLSFRARPVRRADRRDEGCDCSK
jgi:hypothetical protein